MLFRECSLFFFVTHFTYTLIYTCAFNLNSYYETIQVLGAGSMGSVTKVKKRESVIGGSARQDYVNSIHGIEGFCFSLPIIGHMLRSCTGRDLGQRVKRDLFVTSPSSLDTERDIRASSTSGRSRSFHRSPSSTISYARKELYFALKTIHLDRVTDQQLVEELQNEIDILRSMDHPNIVRALETYDYRNNSSIVLELCEGGDLYTRDPYSEADALRICTSLLSAVEYMHYRNICHRDLKYEVTKEVLFCWSALLLSSTCNHHQPLAHPSVSSSLLVSEHHVYVQEPKLGCKIDRFWTE
jgi:serine/threonine protein kinase